MRPIVEIYFYPRPPRGGRHNSLNGWATDIKFLSTPSARRATKRVTQKGGDRRFLSTPSARRATSRRAIRSLMGAYFYPRPPRGGRQSCPHSRLQRLGISIHALREEGDHLPRSWHLAAANFYPRPPRGGRPSRQTKMVSALRFLSTPSARRATRAFHSTVPGLRYFYPRPPRGGRQSCPHSRLQRLGISIHALREEGDLHPGDVDWPPVISIHALREEGDISSSAVFSAMGVFLSTPSARRATPEWRGMLRSGCNFYPRPPRGGRRRGVWLFSTCPHISIHALREEGDVCAIYDISELISFLSTPSARRATCCGPRGGDSGCYFYPRPPRGGRLNTYEQRLAATGFLSTPSARRATATATSLGYSVEISIHALREEGDGQQRQGCHDPYAISIHALREEGDASEVLLSLRQLGISIHALREEGDPQRNHHAPEAAISIHALREEGDPLPTPVGVVFRISIHALREEGDCHPAQSCKPQQ